MSNFNDGKKFIDQVEKRNKKKDLRDIAIMVIVILFVVLVWVGYFI